MFQPGVRYLQARNRKYPKARQTPDASKSGILTSIPSNRRSTNAGSLSRCTMSLSDAVSKEVDGGDVVDVIRGNDIPEPHWQRFSAQGHPWRAPRRRRGLRTSQGPEAFLAGFWPALRTSQPRASRRTRTSTTTPCTPKRRNLRRGRETRPVRVVGMRVQPKGKVGKYESLAERTGVGLSFQALASLPSSA